MRRITLWLFILLICGILPKKLLSQTTLYYNARIFTADTNNLHATWFTVKDKRFSALGNTLPDSILQTAQHKIDLKGQTVIPGIVDSHIHFVDGSLGLIQPNLTSITNKVNLTVFLDTTKNQVYDGIYIARGLGFEVVKHIDNPRKYLDSIFVNVPAVLFMKSGHAAIANTAAIESLQFNSDTKIEAGTLGKDQNGKLNGWLLEEAAMQALAFFNSTYSDQTISKAILCGQNRALSYGITEIGDNTFSPYNLKIYQKLSEAGLFHLRVWARSYGRIPETTNLMSSLGIPKLGFIGKANDFHQIHYHATKYFVDMSLAVPKNGADSLIPGGEVFINRKQLRAIFLLYPTNTFAFHVQGKRGVQNIIDALNDVSDRISIHRNVIDHAGYISPAQIGQLKALNQCNTILASQAFDYPGILNEYKTGAKDFNSADLLNARIKYQQLHGALTSDWPYGMDTTIVGEPEIDALNPFANMAISITGTFPDGNKLNEFENKTLSKQQALISYTNFGAYVLGNDLETGKIANGYKADFCVLRYNLLDESPDKWYLEKPDSVYIGGQLVYQISKPRFSTNNAPRVRPHDYTLSPIFGYDPVIGFVYGAGAFYYPLKSPAAYLDFQVMLGNKSAVNLESNFKYFGITPHLNFTNKATYTNFIQYYFGEGDKTEADNFYVINANRFYLHPEFTWKLQGRFKLSLLGDLRTMNSISAEKNDVGSRLPQIQNESGVALGAKFIWDSRNNDSHTQTGSLVALSLEDLPLFLKNSSNSNTSLLQIDIRTFHYIRTSQFVLAGRLAAGTTWGASSYLYRYQLGGASQLRGYYSNRFRGTRYALGQAEFRFPIYKRFSGAAFTDAGDITNTTFNQILVSWGAGIRFALRENIRLRLDYGIGKDQNGVFFTFGEAF